MHIFQIIFTAILAVGFVAGCIKVLRKIFGAANSGSPTDKPRVWRWEGITLAGLFGVGLVLWPFLSFGAIFMFDSPLQNRSDEVSRYTVAYFIWFYPVTYVVTLLAYYLLRRCGVWRVVSCLIWGLPVAAYFILSANLTWRGQPSNAGRVQLLYRTDYAALLAACREMAAHRSTYAKIKERYGSDFINPKDPKIPATIAALHPDSIIVSDDSAVLELHGEFDAYGVVSMWGQAASDYTNTMSQDVLLVPYLWFNDDELSYQDTDRAAYLNKLRALKPADAPAPKW